LGYGLAAVSYDRTGVLKRFSDRRNIGFTLLADPQSTIIKAFGLEDSGYAHPIIFVIDTSGIIKKRFSGSHYTERPSVSSVIKALQ
jgi:peroxiredoxin